MQCVFECQEGCGVSASQDSGCRFAAKIGGGLPSRAGLGDDGAFGIEARVQVGLLFGPIVLGALHVGGDGREVEVVDGLVIALHFGDLLRQMGAGVNPVGSFFLDGGGVAKGLRAGFPFVGDQGFHLLAVGAAIVFLDASELVDVIGGGAEFARCYAHSLGQLLPERESVEEIGRGGYLIVHLGADGAELRLRGGKRGALAIDLRAQVGRQVVKRVGRDDDDRDYQRCGG